MSLVLALPILGTIQSLMALVYLVARRRTSFTGGAVAMALFRGLAFSVYDSPGAAAGLGRPDHFDFAVALAWAFIPPLAVMFGRDVAGVPKGAPGSLAVITVAPALALGLWAALAAPSCLLASPCIRPATLAHLWGMLVGLGAAVVLGRSLLLHQARIVLRPLGHARFTLALLMAAILFLRAVAEGAAMTGAETAGGTAVFATVGIVLALTVVSFLVFRLFPEPPEAQEEVVESDQINRFRRHLAQAVVFEEGGVGPLVRGTVLTTILTVLALIAWSGITPVKESAVTFGSVVPLTNIRPIQHLEGGIVAEVLVKEGQLVQAGEVLLRLDPAQAKAELEQLKAREAGLEL